MGVGERTKRRDDEVCTTHLLLQNWGKVREVWCVRGANMIPIASFALSDGAEGVGVRVVWSRYVKCRFKYKDQKEEAEPLLPAAVRLGEVAS
ncbi:hypothetical protein VTI28DRAFT_9901 [Corynascus sepedonium]